MLRKSSLNISEMDSDDKTSYRFNGVRMVTLTLLLAAGFLSFQAARKMIGGVLESKRFVQTKEAISTVSQRSGPCDKPAGIGSKGNEQQIVSYMGVSFVYDRSLATYVKPEIVAATPLEREGEKPDSVNPRHVTFSFVGPYASTNAHSFFQPMIRVYPIEGFKNALAASPEDVQAYESEVEALSSLLAGDQVSIPLGAKIPFLPYGVDASQEFHSHLKRISFEQGTGVAFLTQYNIEPSLVNNEGLFYTFQGLTYDRRFYISATFPTSASFLPSDYAAQTTQDYKLSFPTSAKGWARFDAKYQRYLGDVTNKLEQAPSDKFEPKLESFRKIIESLCVNPSL
jgi:hypothetical protein